MSGAMARYPAAASASNWCRHEYQHSGKPWQRSTVGPLPASARCIRMPFVSINRSEIVIANLRKIIDLIANQSHCELQPQPKWLRRHPVERPTAKTTCSTNLFSSPHPPPAASAQGRLRVIFGPDGPEIRLPLFTRKRTQVGHHGMSEMCHQRKSPPHSITSSAMPEQGASAVVW